MKIESWPIEKVLPYDKNPRLNEKAVEPVARSLAEFGFRQPLVVDADGVLIVGHTRLLAAKSLGMTEVPVHVTDLSEAQIRAYRIADNRTAEIAEWDYDLLPIELGELRDMEFDLDLIGFSTAEIAKLVEPNVTEGLTDPDQVPEPPDEPITQPGDLWILGEHRLLCGDSANPADVDRLLDGADIHLCSTDPPYNVKVEPRSNNAIAAGLSSFQGTSHHQKLDVERHPEKAKGTTAKMRPKDRPLANDFVTDEEFDRLLDAWFGNIARVLLPGRGFYVWGGYANLGNYPPFLKQHDLYFSQAIVWDKQHPVLTRKDYMGAFELCQPPDTQVLTPDGNVPIASLRDDDRVVGFSRRWAAVMGPRQGFRVDAARRTYDGPLYGVAVGDHTSWCTDGHIWTVRFAPRAKSLWCVYLMRRGNWWRIGKTRMFSTWGFGLKQRTVSESADAAWVLSVHTSNSEAMLAEQRTSILYGIPTTFWKHTPTARRTVAQVEAFYETLDLDRMRISALRCLADHHRRVEYPFIDASVMRDKYGTRVSLKIRACNLIPGAMEVPVPGGEHRYHWTELRHVDVQAYCGAVYSLGVDRYEHYIADGIITHNCFYGWKLGAGHQFLGPNNATDLWHVKKVNPQSMIHLTEKSVELTERAVQYSSREGENVLDLFGGSGSTLIGCERTDRRAFLMEIDELYCDVIVRRWEEFTGGKAERLSTASVA